MDIISLAFTAIVGVMFKIFGVIILLGITVAIGKVMFDISTSIVSYIWKTIHQPSYQSFLNKRKEKKTKKVNIKKEEK